jgi:hypothetical protein
MDRNDYQINDSINNFLLKDWSEQLNQIENPLIDPRLDDWRQKRYDYANIISYLNSQQKAYPLSRIAEEFPDAPSINRILLYISKNDFIIFSNNSDTEKYLLPKYSLFKAAIDLNKYIARQKIFVIKEKEIHLYLSGKLGIPLNSFPEKVKEFLFIRGLVKKSWSTGYYFPIARILSFLTDTTIGMLNDTLLESCYKETKVVRNNEYFAEKIFDIFNDFDERSFWITLNRIGFWDNKIKTLADLGKEAHITRERVRQLEKKFWTQTKKFEYKIEILRLLILWLLDRRGTLIFEQLIEECNPLIFILKFFNIPFTNLSESNLILIGSNNKDFESYLQKYRVERKEDITLLVKNLEKNTVSYFSSSEYKYIFIKNKLNIKIQKSKIDRVIEILKILNKPSHYSEVANKYFKVYANDISSDHSIYAILANQKHGIVWVGVRGIYALKQWGYNKPEKDLYESVTEIVSNIYNKTHQGVSTELIRIELGKYRKLITNNSFGLTLAFNENIKAISKGQYVPAGVINNETDKDNRNSDIEGQRVSEIIEKLI